MVVGVTCFGIVFRVCFEMRAQGGAALHFLLCMCLIRVLVFSGSQLPQGWDKGTSCLQRALRAGALLQTFEISLKLLGKCSSWLRKALFEALWFDFFFFLNFSSSKVWPEILRDATVQSIEFSHLSLSNLLYQHVSICYYSTNGVQETLDWDWIFPCNRQLICYIFPLCSQT